MKSVFVFDVLTSKLFVPAFGWILFSEQPKKVFFGKVCNHFSKAAILYKPERRANSPPKVRQGGLAQEASILHSPSARQVEFDNKHIFTHAFNRTYLILYKYWNKEEAIRGTDFFRTGY